MIIMPVELSVTYVYSRDWWRTIVRLAGSGSRCCPPSRSVDHRCKFACLPREYPPHQWSLVKLETVHHSLLKTNVICHEKRHINSVLNLVWHRESMLGDIKVCPYADSIDWWRSTSPFPDT